MLKLIKSNSIRCVVVLLLLTTLLTFSVGGVVSVDAASVTSEFKEVLGAKIEQLKDIYDNVLTDPQKAIFYALLGSWAVSQAGMNDYKLVNPYTNNGDVRTWLKMTGIELYNDMLDLIGGNIYNPLTGTNITPELSHLVGYALGAAGTVQDYETEEDFYTQVNSQDHYFVPYDPVLQASINAYFGRAYGLWNWQFDVQPFSTTRHYFEGYYSPSIKAQFEQDFATYPEPHVRINLSSSGSSYNCLMADDTFFVDYCNLFVNTDTHTIYFAKNDGTLFTTQTFQPDICEYIQDNQIYSYWSSYINFNNGWTYNVNTYPTVVSAVNAFFDNVWISNLTYVIFYSDFITHVYAGSNWATKHEVYNMTDLNFAQNDVQSYNEVPDNTLLDIKGLLASLVNSTDLFNIVLNNLFDPSGDLITLPDIKVSISLPDDNPLPVNLNEVSLYLDNDYLDVVKQSATYYGDTIGQWFVFWHNSDPALLYTLLGSAIVILVGAFIGKWGHS